MKPIVPWLKIETSQLSPPSLHTLTTWFRENTREATPPTNPKAAAHDPSGGEDPKESRLNHCSRVRGLLWTDSPWLVQITHDPKDQQPQKPHSSMLCFARPYVSILLVHRNKSIIQRKNTMYRQEELLIQAFTQPWNWTWKLFDKL
jgi:hypothetical protein